MNVSEVQAMAPEASVHQLQPNTTYVIKTTEHVTEGNIYQFKKHLDDYVSGTGIRFIILDKGFAGIFELADKGLAARVEELEKWQRESTNEID